MPLYDYRCADCKHTVEIRHGFDDTYSEVCSKCGGPMNRVFNPAPIVFKGSGFYINDSRPKSGSGSAAAPADSKPATTTEAKPAAEASTSESPKSESPKSESPKSEKPKTASSDSAA